MSLRLTIIRFFSISLLTLGLGTSAQAVPYASQVRDLGGNMREFVLNEPADSITVLRNGANPVTIATPAAGRHTFDMTGFSSFEIQVNKNDTNPNWHLISDPSNAFTNFERPRGLAVNKIPSSPYFGTVYVANPRTTTTVSGRLMGDGIYANSANLIGVDLANNFAVVADPNDTTQAKAPGFTVNVSATSSPWKLALDEVGNVIVSDWSDGSGGVKWATPDLVYGGLILGTELGPAGGVPSTVSDELGPIPLHGSIASEVITSGSVGNNLVIMAIDEDLDAQLSFPNNDGDSIWRWNVGADRSSTKPGEESFTPHTINPTLVIDATSLGQDTATPSAPNFLSAANPPTTTAPLAEAFFSAQHNKWYLTSNRDAGTESGLVILTPGATAQTSTVDFASRSFSFANSLDGNTNATTGAGFQDILRAAGQVKLSPDGTKMYIHRIAVHADNPYLGQTSNLAGAVLEIPLDANGLPIITVDQMGTPTDFTDDRITNWNAIAIASNNSAHLPGEIEFDAAGNMYIISNVSERLEVFSPGGNKRAITRSNGTFEVQPITSMPVAGDYNGNGTVGPEDYTLWASKFGQPAAGSTLVNLNPAKVGTDIDASDYTFWRDLLPGASSAGAVPEPGTLVVTLVALGGFGAFVRRK